MMRSLLMLLVLASFLAMPAQSQFHSDYCYYSMMLDNRGALPEDLGTAPAALLISVIDYTNVYIPVVWEETLVKRFLDNGQNLEIDLKIATSGMALNKPGGDEELAKKLREKGVKNVFVYTIIYQRTPARIKTGHTVTVAPFTGDASIIDMAGRGHSYLGKSLREALNNFASEFKPRGKIGTPEMIGLKRKARVTEAVQGLPDLSDANFFMHGYYDACVPAHPPVMEDWMSHYESLEERNSQLNESRNQLDAILKRHDMTLNYLFLGEDLKKTMGAKDYILVPLDDTREKIQTQFIPIMGQEFMNKVPHDIENPHYQFGLFHPQSGKLYMPNVESRGYENFFETLEDGIRAASAAR